MKSGAWKCLFLLAQGLSHTKINEIKTPSGESLEVLAKISGWETEYHSVEAFILDLQAGKTVDINTAIEKVIAASNGSAESMLLIATDEDCSLHIPLVKGPSSKRMRQMIDQSENEERLKVLVGTPPYGILMMDRYLETDLWLRHCQEAPIADILRVHEYSYIKNLIDLCKKASNDTGGNVNE